MRNIIKAALGAVGISVEFAAPAAAGSLEEAAAAYSRGDFATARMAADQGVAKAQNNLGNMYYHGLGVAQDYAKAAKWYRKAADQGHANAQFNLGGMYVNGQGVRLDYIQAHMWWNLAVSQGDEDATSSRDKVAGMMTLMQIAEAQKLAREWKPK